MSIQAIFNKFFPQNVNTTSAFAGVSSTRSARSLNLHAGLLEPVVSFFGSLSKEKGGLERLSKKVDRELIQEYSLLDKPLDKSVLPLTGYLPALLGQIHADSLCGGSDLEKLSVIEGLETWLAYLQNAKSITVSPTLILYLQQLIKLCAIQKDLTEKKDPAGFAQLGKQFVTVLNQITDGQGIYIEGGRVDGKGITHPVIFQFSKQSNGHFDLIVHVMDKGEKQYRTTISQAHKKWIHPTIYYRNIPTKALFFSNESEEFQPDFFQAILETKFTPHLPEDFVHFRLLAHLQSYRVEEKACHTLPFISEPNADTGAWRIGKPIVRNMMGKKEYKRVMAEIKLQTLVEGYQLYTHTLAEDSPEGEKLRTLFKQGAGGLRKAVLVALQKGWMSEQEIQVYRATATDLLGRLEKIEQAIRAARKKRSTPLVIDFSPDTEMAQLRVRSLSAAKEGILQPEQDNEKIVPCTLRPFILPPAKNLVTSLSDYLKSAPPHAKTRVFELEMLVDALPLPGDTYWKQLPDDQLTALVECVQQILKFYDTGFKTSVTTPKSANTVFALYALTHSFALRIEEKKFQWKENNAGALKSYPLYYPGIEYDSDPYLMFTSPHDFERREAIRNYFKHTFSTNQPDILFQFDQKLEVNETTKLKGYLKWLEALARDWGALNLQSVSKVERVEAILSNLFSENREENCFVKAGLGYIPTLAFAAVLAHEFATHSSARSSERKYRVPFSKGANGDLRIHLFQHKSGARSLPMHPAIKIESVTFLVSYDWNSRLTREDTRGQEGLLLKAEEEELLPFKDLMREACEPVLYPYKLLSYYTDHIADLEMPDSQVIFEIEFFRSISYEPAKKQKKADKNFKPYLRRSQFPIVDELKKKHLVEQCRQFIQEGYACYVTRQTHQRPRVVPLLFFFRFALRLAAFSEGVHFFDVRSSLQELLKREDLSNEERSAVCLHLVASFNVGKKALTPQEKEQLFSAWIYYKNTPLLETWHSPLFEREVESYVHTLGSTLENFSQDFYHQAFKVGLEQNGMDKLPPTCTLNLLAPYLVKVEWGAGSFWYMHLLSGQLINESGPLQRTQPPHWVKDGLFDRLFGVPPSSFMITGETVYFQHPRLGACRVVAHNLEKGLQRNISGAWYQYLPPESLSSCGIPYALIAGHTHWLAPAGTDPLLLISNQATGHPVAHISTAGEVVAEKKQFHFAAQGSLLAQFDRPEYTLIVSHNQKPTLLHYTRYTSLGGEPLLFDCDKGRLIFKANRKYFICENQRKDHFQGIQPYLLLTHQEGEKEKILIPCLPIGVYQPLGSHHKLDRENEKPAPLLINQAETRSYLEYDVVGEKIVPLTQEGVCFLAYLSLAKRDYVGGLQLLRSLDFRDHFSPVSREALKWLIALADEGKDPAGEAAAVALYAWIITHKVRERSEVEGHKVKNESISKTRAYETYLRLCHKIPAPLHLSETELKYLPTVDWTYSLELYPQTGKFKPAPLRGYGEVIEKDQDLLFEENKKIMVFSAGHEVSPVLDDFESKILAQTSFLHKPSDAFTSHYRSPHFLLQSRAEDPSYFGGAYGVAQHGTAVEREVLAFRLQLMGEQYRENPPEAWSYLQFAFHHADSTSGLPYLPDHKNFGDRWNFIKELSSRIIVARRTEKRTEGDLGAEKQVAPSGIVSRPYDPVWRRDQEVKAVEVPLQLVIPGKESVDGGFTGSLFSAYFSPLPNTDTPFSAEKLLAYDPAWLAPEQKIYERGARAEVAEFTEDVKEGQTINQQEILYAVEGINHIKTALTGRIEEVNRELTDLEATILELANHKPHDQPMLQMKEEANLHQELSLKNLVTLFLQGDKRWFYEANPHLKDKTLIDKLAQAYHVEGDGDLAVDYLYQLIGLYLNLSIYRDRLKRSEQHCKDIELIADLQNPARFSAVQKLAFELNPLKQADDFTHSHPALLVCEYFLGKRLRKKQFLIIKEFLEIDPATGNYYNRVSQLMMGEGKTTVIGLIVLMLAAARAGRLALFVVPAAQYTSVRSDLRRAYKEYFGKEVEEIDLVRKQLSYEMCTEVERRCHEAMKRGNFLLVKAESLQCLELEFLDRVYRVFNADAHKVTQGDILHINVLRRILLLLRERGDALLDEVDSLLNVLHQMNFPIGDEELIDLEWIELIKEIMTVMVSKKTQVDAETFANLNEIIGLEKNRQTLLPLKDLHGVVAEAVARHLCTSYEPLRLKDKPELHASFYRYISGKMDPDLQQYLFQDTTGMNLTLEQQNDLEFLARFYYAKKSENRDEKQSAHLWAIVKHMFLVVFPVTFQNKGNQNYGEGGVKPGEKRPFTGVFVPSSNLFGYPWEAIAYHLQAALQNGIAKAQLKAVFSVYRTQAESEARHYQCTLGETDAAKEFTLFTNVELGDFHLPGMLKKALAYLKEHPEARLGIETSSALEHVRFYPEKLTSTSSCIPNMFSTKRAFSGTPYNVIYYNPSLAKNFKPDVGTEGRIAAKVLSRAHTRSCIHTLEGSDLKQMLKDLLEKHPEKHRVRLLADRAALFKYSNYEVARALRDVLKMPILFFTYDAKRGQKTPDTLALLKLESDEPVLIGGTRLEDIEKTGLGINDYFVYLDDNHTTGTDIPLPDDAIGLVTLDEKILRRNVFQTILRLRGYFWKQDIELVIPKHVLPNQLSKSVVDDLQVQFVLSALVYAVINQGVAKSKQYRKFCKQYINTLFREELLACHLLPQELDVASIKGKFAPFKEVVVPHQKNAPAEQLGDLEKAKDCVQLLERYGAKKLAVFGMARPPPLVLKKLSGQIQEVIQEAALSPYLPSEDVETADDLEILADVMKEEAVQLHVDIHQEIEHELLQELAFYQREDVEKLRLEDLWKQQEITAALAHIQKGEMKYSGVSEIFPLTSLFSSSYYTYKRDFSKVFDDRLLVTLSWAKTAEETLSVFHSMQRLADTILIVKTPQGYRGVLLAQNECTQFKEYLEEEYPKNPTLSSSVWLVQPNRALFAGATPLPLHPDIDAILLQCHVFNGRIDYLDAHPKSTTQWLNEDKNKLDFIKQKVGRDKTKIHVFYRSGVFGHQKVVTERAVRTRRLGGTA